MIDAPSQSVSSALQKDIWVHIGGLLAVAMGFFDVFYGGEKLGLPTDLIFIIGGFAAQGVKIVNGSASAAGAAATIAISNIAATVAAQAATTAATLATQQTMAALAQAQALKDVAATTAAVLKEPAGVQAQSLKDTAADVAQALAGKAP